MSINENMPYTLSRNEQGELIKLADLFLNYGQKRNAVVLYIALALLGDQKVRAFIYLSRTLLEMKKYRLSHKFAEKALKHVSKNDINTRKAIAVIACKSLWNQGKHSEARQALSQWTTRSSHNEI